jgi:hypothetical protein
MKKILTLIAIAGLVVSATAQDIFKATRTVVVQAPTTLGAATLTNAMVDLLGFQGIAKLDLITCTNGSTTTPGGAGTLTATILGSNDTNTWAAISYARAVQTSINITNSNFGTGGTNWYQTDVYLLPGTNTYPTAYSAGFATPYLVYPAMTNQTAVTFAGSAVVQVGFNVNDSPRYLQVVWTATGTSVSNATVSAVLTAFRGY